MTGPGANREPVAITGLGVTAPCGIGIEAFWQSLMDGEDASAASPPSRFEAPVPPRAFTLEGRGFEPEEHYDPRVVRRLPRYSAMSLIAADGAVREAGMSRAESDPARERAGVVLATAFGSSVYHFEYYEGLFERGLKEASPLLFSESVMNAAAGHITHRMGLRGAGLALVGGEDAGLHALSTSLDLLRSGALPFALAGGTDEYCDLLHAGLYQEGVVGGEIGRPLHASPGLCLYGEGAAIIFLERQESAAARGAPVVARLMGAGSGRVPPGRDPAGAVERAVRAALADAGVEASSIGLVVSGADGGELDRVEVSGVERALGATPSRHVCAPKRWTGEAFAFSSTALALVAAMALSRGELPETAAAGSFAGLPDGWRADRPLAGGLPSAAVVVSATRHGGATALVLGSAA